MPRPLKPSFGQMSIIDLIAEQPKPKSFTKVVIELNPRERMDTRQWGEQLRRVYEVMTDGRWRTLEEITYAAGYKPNSIGAVSARIRDLPGMKVPYEKR